MTKLIQESKALATAYLAHNERIAIGLNEETKFSLEPPGEAGEEGDDTPEAIEILCRDLLQNFIVHYFLASQIEGEIYEKIAGVTPAVNSCDFMGIAIEHAEEIRMTKLNNKKKDVRETSDVFFNVTDNVRESKSHISKERASKSCFNCGNNDHFIKECPNCFYCKKKGHDTFRCYKRRDDNVPYCTYCKKDTLPKIAN